MCSVITHPVVFMINVIVKIPCHGRHLTQLYPSQPRTRRLRLLKLELLQLLVCARVVFKRPAIWIGPQSLLQPFSRAIAIIRKGLRPSPTRDPLARRDTQRARGLTRWGRRGGRSRGVVARGRGSGQRTGSPKQIGWERYRGGARRRGRWPGPGQLGSTTHKQVRVMDTFFNLVRQCRFQLAIYPQSI